MRIRRHNGLQMPAQGSTKGTDPNDRPLRLQVILFLIVVVSFALRVAALAYYGIPGAINSEGAEYARIAENLRNGVGYVGIATPGPEVNFPPLYPLLIAGISFLTHSYEWAGRVVAIILGALLPLPSFGIASHIFSRRVGVIAAALASLHPLLVNLSCDVLSEAPYATLLLSSVYVTIRALKDPSIKLWALAGAAFGLTYLLRAEATGVFAVAVLFALAATDGSMIARCRRAAIAILTFLVLASPQVAFIYKSTGKLRLEVKSSIFFYTAGRILTAETTPGTSYESVDGGQEMASSEPNIDSWEQWEEKWALYGIDSRFNGTGMAMRPFPASVRDAQITPRELSLLLKGIAKNGPVILQQLGSVWLGAPFLPALALLGALRRPWRGPKAPGRLFFMFVAAIPLLANPFALDPDEPRYSFIFVALFCVWAANGLAEVGLWTKASAASAGWNVLTRPTVAQCIIPGIIGLATVISPLKAVRRLNEFTQSALPTRVDKEVGLWIGRQQNQSVRILDRELPLAYHAGAQFSYFPYCTSESALGYLDAAKIDYIILRRGQKYTKCYAEWLTHGISDSRAEAVHVSPAVDAEFIIYRWHRGS
jgi:4-amino-4-deoxy-L-arabinose transferase-like glycosyltransferase